MRTRSRSRRRGVGDRADHEAGVPRLRGVEPRGERCTDRDVAQVPQRVRGVEQHPPVGPRAASARVLSFAKKTTAAPQLAAAHRQRDEVALDRRADAELDAQLKALDALIEKFLADTQAVAPVRNPAFNAQAYRLADEGKQKSDTKQKTNAKKQARQIHLWRAIFMF